MGCCRVTCKKFFTEILYLVLVGIEPGILFEAVQNYLTSVCLTQRTGVVLV